MPTSSKPPANAECIVPDLDLPVLPEAARHSPVLTMDQYLAWNTRDEFDPGDAPGRPEMDRCLAVFEL